MKGARSVSGSPSAALVPRRLVNALLGLGCVGTASGCLGAVLGYLWPMPVAGGSDQLVGAAGPLSAGDIADDQGVVGRSRLGKVLVIRKKDELVGLLATCTHLGCTVTWNATTQQVECPCHGARYNIRGDVLRGPARQPLGPVTLAVEAGAIHVRPALRG